VNRTPPVELPAERAESPLLFLLGSTSICPAPPSLPHGRQILSLKYDREESQSERQGSEYPENCDAILRASQILFSSSGNQNRSEESSILERLLHAKVRESHFPAPPVGRNQISISTIVWHCRANPDVPSGQREDGSVTVYTV